MYLFFCFCFISFYFNPTWRTLDISSPNFVYRQTNKQTNTRSCLYSCSTTKKGPAGLKPVRDIVPEFMNWCWVIQHLPITWVIKYNIDLNHLFTNKRDFNNSLPFIKYYHIYCWWLSCVVAGVPCVVVILCGRWSTLCGRWWVGCELCWHCIELVKTTRWNLAGPQG